MYENQENSNSSEQINFDSIKDFPEKLLLYVDKYVKVQLLKNTSFSGYLHSIDPITLSVILSIPCDGDYQTTIIPGHAVINIEEEIPSTNVTPPTRKCTSDTIETNLIKKKSQLTTWFKKNFLPVEENEDNLVVGNVSVLPPYNSTDISAENPIVALQIRKIIEAMPQDFSH